jgi:prepilin-type N-terminal cleavage/methylation domain-containing protein
MTSTVTQQKKQFGFTLIEISIVITLIGFAVAASTITFTHFSNSLKARVTEERMNKILNALSVYAQKNYRVPCGAAPDAAGAAQGTEPNSGRCFNRVVGLNNNLDAMGVVPWKVLGLTEQDATDGWDRYFTYKPAPHLTLDNTSTTMMTATNNSITGVHDACRTVSWFNNEGRHVNRAKALFCCNAEPKTTYLTAISVSTNTAGWNNTVSAPTSNLGTLTDVPSGDSLGAAVVGFSNRWIEKNADGRVGDFSDAMTETNNISGQSSLIRATGIAVSLISHGSNGKFSFLRGQPKSTRNRGTFDANTGALLTNDSGAANLEILNALQATAGYINNPKAAINDTMGGGTLIDFTGQKDNASDDMSVMVRTDQLISRVGSNSCLKLGNIETPRVVPVNGVCGTANLTTSATAPLATPTSNLCNTGIPNNITGAGPWSWDCTGIDGGTTRSCLTFKSPPPTSPCNLGPLETIATFEGAAGVPASNATCIITTYTATMVNGCPTELAVPVGTNSPACLNTVWFNATPSTNATACVVGGRICQ